MQQPSLLKFLSEFRLIVDLCAQFQEVCCLDILSCQEFGDGDGEHSWRIVRSLHNNLLTTERTSTNLRVISSRDLILPPNMDTYASITTKRWLLDLVCIYRSRLQQIRMFQGWTVFVFAYRAEQQQSWSGHRKMSIICVRDCSEYWADFLAASSTNYLC